MLHIKVPATSANIGPGFDTLGLALNLYHEIKIEKADTVENTVVWANQKHLIPDDENLVISGISAAFEHFGLSAIPYYLDMCQCDIPVSRGLGSSAAAYVSGIAAGLYLMGKPLDKSLICQIASLLEGHPDNVVPAVFGGIATAFISNEQVHYQPIHIKAPLHFLALIPNVPLSTEKARAILPKVYNRQDVIYNLGRLSMLVAAFSNGAYEQIKEATKDRIHTPYRISLMPDAPLLEAISELPNCLGSFISGAGSTYMLICNPNDADVLKKEVNAILEKADYFWQLKSLSLTDLGMSWEELQ